MEARENIKLDKVYEQFEYISMQLDDFYLSLSGNYQKGLNHLFWNSERINNICPHRNSYFTNLSESTLILHANFPHLTNSDKEFIDRGDDEISNKHHLVAIKFELYQSALE